MKSLIVRRPQWRRILMILVVGILCCDAVIPISPLQAAPKVRSRRVKFTPPAIPPGEPPGGRRGGGAGRDDCPAVAVPLTALIPATPRQKNGKVVEDVWGLAATDKPNFWVYSPYELGDRYNTTFVIRQQNKNGETIGQIPVKLPAHPGLFKIELPSLPLNQRYYWELSIDCSGKSNAIPLKINGVMQRVDLPPAVLQQIETSTTPIEKAQQYAENGIWFEALDLIETGRQTMPADQELQESWRDLLKSVGLDAKQFEP